MSTWPVMTLGDICAEGGGFIRTGPFGSQLHQSDYVDDPDGIPVVMPKDMANGRLDRSSAARISLDTADRLSHHLLAAGDIALSRRGDVGRSAWISEEDLPVLCGTGSMRVHAGQPRSVDPSYLRYFFRSRLSIEYLEGQAVGATMPNLNAEIVTGMPVPVLPMNLQRRAADVLRSMDELIENNRRRVEVLEEMARAIYREWFVHFRYPGHENVPLVDSPLGPIPDGWEAQTIGDVVRLHYGRALKKEDRRGGPVAVVSSAGVVGWHDESVVAGPVIVLGRKGNVGSVTWVNSEAWPIDTAYFVESELPLRYVAEQLRGAKFLNSHAAVPGLSRDQAYSRPFLRPQTWLMESFDAAAGTLGAEARTLRQASERLAELRDLLLPKLVTGQIDVSHLDLDALTEPAIP
jgi:type I restriction enzyme S subunit